MSQPYLLTSLLACLLVTYLLTYSLTYLLTYLLTVTYFTTTFNLTVHVQESFHCTVPSDHVTNSISSSYDTSVVSF